jgi:threonine/homoserine/homoserine lactone efflux protein
MAKRVLGGHPRAAAMVIAGSVSSDVVYGIVALFGLAPFLDTAWVLASFNAVGVVVLWVLAFLTLRESRKPHGLGPEPASFGSKRWAYLTGFSLAATNPPMVLSWLLGVALAKHLGLASPFPPSAKLLFIAGGAAGVGSYLGSLGIALHRFKHFVPPNALGRVYYWLAIALFVLSFYFAFGAIRYFGGGN